MHINCGMLAKLIILHKISFPHQVHTQSPLFNSSSRITSDQFIFGCPCALFHMPIFKVLTHQRQHLCTSMDLKSSIIKLVQFQVSEMTKPPQTDGIIDFSLVATSAPPQPQYLSFQIFASKKGILPQTHFIQITQFQHKSHSKVQN